MSATGRRVTWSSTSDTLRNGAPRPAAFTPGMLLHTAEGRLRFTDPTRRPGQAASLRSGQLAGPRDLAALGALSARDMLLPARLIKRGQDRATRAALARAGISGEFTERFIRPFLAGLFLADELATSSRFFHLVWRSMLRGSLCLPRRGMQSVPDQLADALPPAAGHRWRHQSAASPAAAWHWPTGPGSRRGQSWWRPARPLPRNCCQA